MPQNPKTRMPSPKPRAFPGLVFRAGSSTWDPRKTKDLDKEIIIRSPKKIGYFGVKIGLIPKPYMHDFLEYVLREAALRVSGWRSFCFKGP